MSSFGRYLDTWVVDRVMFEFVNQGGCSCCGIQHGGMGMNDFMAMCSDIETDDGKREKNSPWPQFMQDEIWADRVKLRKELKEGMSFYKEKFEAVGEQFVSWWLSLEPEERQKHFQMPKEELSVLLNTNHNLKTSYQVVMCTVSEQLEKFHLTGYPSDSTTDCEMYFEKHLTVKRGAWSVSKEYCADEKGCDLMFGMMLQLGGPRLLPKSEGATDIDSKVEDSEVSQSFRSDRRLLRLLVFRYFTDKLLRAHQRAKDATIAK